MPTTLPLDVYEALEEQLGKERARKLVHALERAVDAAVDSKWLQVRDELIARLVTKEEFQSALENLLTRIEQSRTESSARIEQVRAELSARIEQVHAELSARIDRLQTSLEAKIERLNLKLNFVLLLLVLLATLWSPTVAELVRKLLGLG